MSLRGLGRGSLTVSAAFLGVVKRSRSLAGGRARIFLGWVQGGTQSWQRGPHVRAARPVPRELFASILDRILRSGVPAFRCRWCSAVDAAYFLPVERTPDRC